MPGDAQAGRMIFFDRRGSCSVRSVIVWGVRGGESGRRSIASPADVRRSS